MKHDWPTIPYPAWRETCEALHLWAQIVGKYRLSLTPWVNHSWHATLYVTSRGFTTGPVPDRENSITLSFDFIDHRLHAEAARGVIKSFPLEPMSVANFFELCEELVGSVGGTFAIDGHPNEIADALPFVEDKAVRPYDAEAVQRFHQALLRIERVFWQFRTGFLGKVSPIHLFWGSFDLAVTRFSGRQAPVHPGGIPGLPDAVTREAYSHEVSSAGFWPGGNGVEEAMFYSYAYPTPDGMKDWKVQPEPARFDPKLGEFLLPYEAIRASSDPQAALLRFLESTYEAAAVTGHYPRQDLECSMGVPGRPRAVARTD